MPLAFDFDVQDAVRACVTIANYELYHAFERMFNSQDNNNNKKGVQNNAADNALNNNTNKNVQDNAEGKVTAANNNINNSTNTNTVISDINQVSENNTHANTFMAMSGVLQALPPQVVGYFNAGK